jgi:hypothetical protein
MHKNYRRKSNNFLSFIEKEDKEFNNLPDYE